MGIGTPPSNNIQLHINAVDKIGLLINSSNAGNYNYGLNIITNNALTKAFATQNAVTGIDNFIIWGNGVVNAQKLYAKEIEVRTDAMGISWPDYVFSNTYKLPTLKEVEEYILKNKHLENVPTAEEVEKNGINVYEINRILLQKIEELTLYTIQLEKRVAKIEKP